MKRIVTAGVAALGLTLIVPQVAHSAETHRSIPTFTMAQVAQHKTATDCWSAVNGGVYNLTTWLPRHTFGPFTVAAICGVDSSAIFNSFGRPSFSSGGRGEHGDGRHEGGDDRAKVGTNRVAVKQAAVIRTDGDHGRRNGRNPALRSIRRYIIGILVTTAPVPTPVPTVTPKPTVTPTPTPTPTVTPTATPTPTPTVTPTPTPTPTVTPPPCSSTATVANPTTCTLAQISAHSSPTNCWVAINSNLYDLTAFLPIHSGGAAQITPVCGLDGTARFTGQHGTSASKLNTLAAYKIGTIV